jgi:hypothetical protein
MEMLDMEMGAVTRLARVANSTHNHEQRRAAWKIPYGSEAQIAPKKRGGGEGTQWNPPRAALARLASRLAAANETNYRKLFSPSTASRPVSCQNGHRIKGTLKKGVQFDATLSRLDLDSTRLDASRPPAGSLAGLKEEKFADFAR